MSFIGEHDIELTRGSSLHKRFAYAIGGVGVDLTGWTARMQVRKKAGAVVVLEASTTNGKLAVDDQGHIDLDLTNDDTIVLDAGAYKYDLVLQLAGPDDAVFLVRGVFQLAPNITEPL